MSLTGWKQVVLISGLIQFSAAASAGDVNKFSSIKSKEEAVQKYRIAFPKGVLIWPAFSGFASFKEIKNDHGINLQYPTCYDLELPGESDLSYLKKSLAIQLNQTERCANFDKSSSSAILFERAEGSSLESIRAVSQDNLVFKENFEWNRNRGWMEVHLNIDSSPITEESKPSLVYRLGFECKLGKQTQLYRVTVSLSYGDASWKKLNSKDYSLPSEAKEILSTFKCVKPKLKYQ